MAIVDARLCRLSHRIVEELPSGRDAIPEFAGTRQRVAYVVVENRSGRPTRILDARGEHWTFDDEGRVGEDMRRRANERIDLISEWVGAEMEISVTVRSALEWRPDNWE